MGYNKDMSNTELTKNGKKRNSGMFKPGVSGNPKGRPKVNPITKDLARAVLPQTIPRLLQIATNPNIKDEYSLKAIQILFNRAFGKP